ncbi:helix-turn-helix domain-containing protein [Trichormus sp. NMC-1]
MGKSVRTVRRLVKKWEEQGLAGLRTLCLSEIYSYSINRKPI